MYTYVCTNNNYVMESVLLCILIITDCRGKQMYVNDIQILHEY